MADVLRSCSKTACRWPAAASLSYRYATRQVWLLDLAPTTDPSLYDLCPHHADALVVPKGWERVDDRTAHEVMVEPSADDRAAAAGRRSATAADLEPIGVVAPRTLVAATAGGNRYADLVAQLPRLAAEAGALDAPTSISAAPRIAGDAGDDAEPPLPPTTIRAAPPAEVSTPATAGLSPAATPRTPAPMPSRELAPLPPAEATWNEETVEPPLPAQPLPPQPLPGQLAIPVDDLDGSDGVVVPFELAGARRRPRP